MLKIKTNLSQTVQPHLLDLAEESRQAKHGIVRRKGNANSADAPVTLFELNEADPQVAYDIFEVDAFHATTDSARGVMHAFVSLVELSSEIILRGTIFDKKTGVELCRLPDSKAVNDHRCELSQTFQIEETVQMENLALSVDALWEAKTGRQELVKTVDLSFLWGGLTYNHNHPVKKAKSSDEPEIIGMKPEGTSTIHDLNVDSDNIVICFLRYPDQYGDVDYMVNFGRLRAGDKPLFGLPGAGTIYAVDGAEFVPEESSGTCYIEPREGGACLGASTGDVMLKKDRSWMQEEFAYSAANGQVYKSVPGDIKIEGSQNFVQYSMMTAWNNGAMRFNEKGNFHSNFYHYTLDLKLWFRINNVRRLFRLLVTSKPVDPLSADEIKKIKPLRIMFGCLAKGTLVLTEQGEIPVEQLRAGNRLMGIHGKAVPVLNTWSGDELNFLVQITADRDRKIRVTADHPMIGEKGFIRAGKLKDGDCVMMEDGKLVPVRVQRVAYNGEVYNVGVGGTAVIIAQGFATGDMDIQNMDELTSGTTGMVLPLSCGHSAD